MCGMASITVWYTIILCNWNLLINTKKCSFTLYLQADCKFELCCHLSMMLRINTVGFYVITTLGLLAGYGKTESNDAIPFTFLVEYQADYDKIKRILSECVESYL